MKQKYLDQIKVFEGFHKKPYWDYRQWTSGYGTKAKHKNESITRATAEWRLKKEMTNSENLVIRFLKKHGVYDDCPDGVLAALTSLTYNAGARWMNAGLGKKIRRGQWTSAKSNFVQYNRAGGKRLAGLVKRRNQEVKWFDDKDSTTTVKPEPIELPKSEDKVDDLFAPSAPSEPVVVPNESIEEGMSGTPWLKTAKAFIGESKEIKGAKDNPVVVAMWHLGRAGNIYEDETPWCAAFVSAVLELQGIKSARTGWSRSYLSWGQRTSKPAVGSIVVFKRGSGGHIGFVVGQQKDGDLLVLGGNQSNDVNVRSFPRSRVLGYMWPEGFNLPTTTALPVYSDYGSSVREI